MRSLCFLSLALAAEIASAQAPLIRSVVNAASGITAGLPNSGIAQGAIFLVLGSGLGPDSISIAQSAFQTTNLSGTSVDVTVNGTTVAALMFYTSASQVSALLPSNTPAGTGTITVTYNSQPSGHAPITVVPNNLGIFTVTSDGQGAAIVTYADYSLVSAARASNCGGPNTTCGAANPGDTLILWATGLGPIQGRDASRVGLDVPMPDIPLKVWLGGLQASVVYQGRSGCCIGEDQIVFVVPQDVPAGCAVPLAVQIDNQVSNYTVLPVAVSGRTCIPVNPVFTSGILQLLTSGQPLSFATIEVRREPNFNSQVQAGNNDVGKAQFISFSIAPAVQPFFISYADVPPPGTCMVYNSLNGGNTPINLIKTLDAGAEIRVTGPNGSQVIPVNVNQSTLAPGSFLSPGPYTVSGTGGANIGGFNTAFTIPAPLILSSPASGPIVPVSRANGMTLAWSGVGASNSYIAIDGLNATDNTNRNGAGFTCLTLPAAGTFTIPPSVFLALPTGPTGRWDFKPGMVPVLFSAPGLDLGSISSSYDTPVFVALQ